MEAATAEAAPPVSPEILRRKRRRQRGSMIVLALSVLTPVMVAGGSLMTSLSAYGREVRFISSQRFAESIASSGAHSSLAMLQADPGLRGTHEVNFPQGLAQITVTDQGTDQVDNDANQSIDDPDEQGILEVHSVGWFQSGANVESWSRSVVIATVRLLTVNMNFEQTLYLDDPYAGIEVDAPVQISAGQNSEGDEMYAVGTPADTDAIEADLSIPAPGSNGNPAVNTVGTTRDLDLERLVELLARAADTSWALDHADDDDDEIDIDELPSGGPSVMYAAGELDIEGDCVGSGVLIVNGDLEIDGSLTFQGLIIVLGQLEISVEGGGANIQGVVLVQGSMPADQEEDLTRPALGVYAPLSIQFSESALQLAAQALQGKLELLTWEQESNVDNMKVTPPPVYEPGGPPLY